jgi:hypothetical protein
MINKGIIKKGVTDPSRIAKPVSTDTKPRYIGFLVKRYNPLVTRSVDFSNGFTVVPASRNALSVMTLISIPKISRVAPIRFQGAGMILVQGSKILRSTITKIEIIKYVGGRILFRFMTIRSNKLMGLLFLYSLI